MNRRAFMMGASAISLAAGHPARAWIHGNGGRVARSVIGLNIFGDNGFLNFAKQIGHSPNDFLSNNYPYQINANGYPLTTGGGTLAASIPNNNGFELGLPFEYVGNWCIFWTGKGAFQIATGATNTPRFNEVGSSGFVNSVTFALNMSGTMNGTTDKVVFNWGVNSPPTGTISVVFPAGASFDGTMTNLVICRVADEAAARANPNAFLPEYITALKALNPKSIRMMDSLLTNGTNRTQSKYRPPTASAFFSVDRFDPNTLVTGDITGTTTGGVDVLTAGSYPDMPGSWTDKETFQGRVTFTSTGVPMTIAVGARAAKTVTDLSFGTPASGTTQVGGTLVTFTYDSALDQCIIWSGGMQASIPYETCVSLANTVGCDLWYNFPHLTDDASITSTVQYIEPNLNSPHRCLFEYSNEVWNGVFPIAVQTAYANRRGTLMGVPNLDSGGGPDVRMAEYSWYGFRVGQMGALIRAARSTTRMKTVLASQGYNLALGFTDQLRFQTTSVGTRIQVTAITNAAAAQVTTGTPHGFSNGDIIGIGGNSAAPSPFPPVAGMTTGHTGVDVGPINGLLFTVANATASTFTLKNTIQTGTNTFAVSAGPTDINSTVFGTYTTPFSYCWKIPVAPNRPIDVVDVVAYATYSSGDTFTNGNYGAAPNMAALLSAAASYASGGGGITTGLNWIDNDYQAGTSSGANGSQCLLGLSNNLYPAWNTLTASYALRTLECYEGGCEMAPPTGAELNSLGFASSGDIAATVTGDTFTKTAHGLAANQPLCFSGSSGLTVANAGNAGPLYYVSASGLAANTFKVSATAGGAVINTGGSSSAINYSIGMGNALAMLIGYKNDARFGTATLNQFNQFTSGSVSAAGSSPSWFQVFGGSQWSSYPGDFFTTPYQSWGAMITFNS